MTSYYDDNQETTHQSRHYESCLNSNCSRSPSPIHRQLWEPKHPPQKLHNCYSKKLPFTPFDTIKQGTTHTKHRDWSPFLPLPRDLNGSNTPKRTRDPLFTYTINEGPFDDNKGTKNIEVKIQKHSDPPLLLSKRKAPNLCESSPPPQEPLSPSNLKLELELDTSRVPPIVTIKNNTITSQTPQTVQLVASPPFPTCTQCFPYSPSPSIDQSSNSFCKCCAHPLPCSPRQTTESVDSVYQSCPCLGFSKENSKEDKATSPTKPDSTPKEVQPCNSTWQACPKYCPIRSSPNIKEDKAISPINPCSRSTSPSSPQNRSLKPIHNSSNYDSDIGSEGTVEISIDEAAKVDIDWEGDVGPINVDFPISETRNQGITFEDQVHSHDPQLEAFYTSSYNQSGSPSASKSRSPSPSPPPSARQNSRSLVPCAPWNSCLHVDNDCFTESHSASVSPSRSPCSPSTACSRSPESKALFRKGLDHNNSFGTIGICCGDKEIVKDYDCIQQCVYSRCEKSSCKSGEEQSNSQASPMLTLTPRTNGNGHMTIEWSSPRSTNEKRCMELNPLSLDGKSPRGNYKKIGPCYYQGEIEKEEKELNSQAIVQGQTHLASLNSSLKYKTCKQSEELLCISSCKPSCTLTSCTLSCDPCQGSNASCNGCCCCKTDCVAPIEGINKCTSLPPHLQSDWSASLRCPQGQVRTKPILYRDSQGHEHIMFADGIIEHLDHHCNPTTLTSPQKQQPSPPPPFAMSSPSLPLPQSSLCQNTFHDEEGNFDQYVVQDFSPQSGDIVIRARQRLSCMYPGKDNGQVAFFTSDYLDLQDGDSIVRFGKFDNSGRWCSSKLVEMYLRGSHGLWRFLGATEGHPVLCPLEADQHQIVRTPNKELKLKLGDLVISTVPGPNSFYFWNPKMKLDCDHSQLLLRAYIGQPQVVDENHNLECCVAAHLPVGYVELYVKVKRIWLFLGRDDHMFSEHELTCFS